MLEMCARVFEEDEEEKERKRRRPHSTENAEL